MAENTIDYASFQGLVSNEDLDAMAETLSRLFNEEGCELVSIALDTSQDPVKICFCARERKTGWTSHRSVGNSDPLSNDIMNRQLVRDVRDYALDEGAKILVVKPLVNLLAEKSSE